jgi:branched-chain amino acid transport system permease protein
VILGGAGSIPGVVLGAALVVILPEAFRGFANARMAVFGFVMMVMMIFRTQGLLPLRRPRFRERDLPGGAATAASGPGAGPAEAAR